LESVACSRGNFLTGQLTHHALYLQSADLREAHYSSKVLELRGRAIRAYNDEKAGA